jgi:SAM-dependent methyltransferase
VAASLARETARLWREDGAGAAARFGLRAARGVLAERLGPARPPRTNELDRQFGTDTAENLKLHGLDIRGPNYRDAVYYRATNFPILEEILGRLPVRHEDCTFVDYGSGKGLVLLKAAGYPFKKVIGVEFARELHEIAAQNLARHPAGLRRCAVELVHEDAVKYAPPAGNLVLYFYEPFEAPVTRQVIARVRDLPRENRDIVIAYVWSKNPRVSCKPLWDAETFITQVDEGGSWTIYRLAGREKD